MLYDTDHYAADDHAYLIDKHGVFIGMDLDQDRGVYRAEIVFTRGPENWVFATLERGYAKDARVSAEILINQMRGIPESEIVTLWAQD